MCFTSFPTGFQVGGRAARDKVTGGAGFSVDVGKDDGGFTPGDGQMQDCLEGGGGDCAPARGRSALLEQAREQAGLLHRLQRAMDSTAARRIAGRAGADPLIRARGTEGVGAHLRISCADDHSVRRQEYTLRLTVG